MDVICSEEDLFENFSAKELRGQLREAMQRVLTERERKILTLRYGLNGDEALTQGETAQLCGISRSYVSRIEKKAMTKLEQELR